MKRLGPAKALEPSSIEKMPKYYSLGIDQGIAQGDIQVETPMVKGRDGRWRPLGACIHSRIRMGTNSMLWHCRDCGIFL